jgi:hypothetical protein
MRILPRLFIFCLVLGGLVHARPAQAQQLDQSLTGPFLNLGANINEGARYIAQTYTAGLTGALFGVSINILAATDKPSIPLRVLLLDTSAGIPTSTILGQGNTASNTVDLSTIIPISGNVSQIAGHTYTIAVFAPTAPAPGAGQGIGVWGGFAGQTDPYPGGSIFSSNDLSTWFSFGGNEDVFFKTFVNVTSAPEPGSLAFLSVVALPIVRIIRRRA